MIVYWSMFLSVSVCALVLGPRAASLAYGMQSARLNSGWVLVWLVLTLLIGYRFEVGGDWGTYLRHLQESRYQDINSAVAKGVPAYRLLNLLAVKLGWGISGVNVVSASLF